MSLASDLGYWEGRGEALARVAIGKVKKVCKCEQEVFCARRAAAKRVALQSHGYTHWVGSSGVCGWRHHAISLTYTGRQPHEVTSTSKHGVGLAGGGPQGWSQLYAGPPNVSVALTSPCQHTISAQGCTESAVHPLLLVIGAHPPVTRWLLPPTSHITMACCARRNKSFPFERVCALTSQNP